MVDVDCKYRTRVRALRSLPTQRHRQHESAAEFYIAVKSELFAKRSATERCDCKFGGSCGCGCSSCSCECCDRERHTAECKYELSHRNAKSQAGSGRLLFLYLFLSQFFTILYIANIENLTVGFSIQNFNMRLAKNHS